MRFYTLDPLRQEPGVRASVSAPGPVRTLSIGPVTIPDVVDRPQLVVRRSANQVDLLEQHRWAQSLASAIAEVLAENLAVLLPQTSVSGQNGNAGRTAGSRLAVEIVQFEAVPGEAVVIKGRWTIVSPGTGNFKTGSATIREPARGPAVAELVAAFDRGLARLSASIAIDLQP